MALALSNSSYTGYFNIPINLVLNDTAYGFDFTLGTPPQQLSVKIDTGSAYIDLNVNTSVWCTNLPGSCTAFGTYDNYSSSTAEYVSSAFFSGLGAMLLPAGDYVNDTLAINGLSIPDFQVGQNLVYLLATPMTNWAIYGQNFNILGLQYAAGANNENYNDQPTFVNQIYDQGIISSRSYSLYLPPGLADGGHLLLGGRDMAKTTGTQLRVPQLSIQNPPTTPGSQFSGTMACDGILIGNTTVAAAYTMLLDSGSPGTMLPASVAPSIISALRLNNTSGSISQDTVPCSVANIDFTLTFAFGGVNIQVPISDFIIPSSKSPGSCTIMISTIDGESLYTGPGFMRGAYLTWDMDNLEMVIGQAIISNDTDIVKTDEIVAVS